MDWLNTFKVHKISLENEIGKFDFYEKKSGNTNSSSQI